MLLKQSPELILKGKATVVSFLAGNVTLHASALRLAYRKRSIARLPLE
jgi:hypothetical protein